MKRITLVFACIIVITGHVNAQFKNLKLEEGEGSAPAIAVNKKDPKNLVAVTQRGNIYYTIDGGFSWKKTKLTSSAGVSGQPIITTDDKDNFFITHSGTVSGVQRIIIHESKDKGATWSEDEFIDDDEETLTKDQRWYSVTPDSKGGLHATWTQSDSYGSADTSCTSTIMYSQSSNGKKWSTPKKLSLAGGHCKADVDMTLGSSCGVRCGWKSLRGVASAGQDHVRSLF